MKILQINKFYYERRGAESYFFDLQNLLESKGHQVIPFAMADERNRKTPYEKYFVSQVDLVAPRFALKDIQKAGRVIYSFEAKRKIEKLIKAERPEIAHIHNIYHQLSPSILPVFRKYHLPVVMTVHDFKLICPNYSLFTEGKICERCRKHKYYEAIIHRCLKDSLAASALACVEMYLHHNLWQVYERYVDLFIAPSEFTKKKLVEWGMDARKIKVLPHFVKLDEKKKLANGEKYILYFGSLTAGKGVDVLLRAMQRNREIKLKIVGEGRERKELETMAEAMNLNNVEFFGQKKREFLNQLIEGALFVVAPSRAYETFGLSILESFARGKAVIATNLGSYPELVHVGQTGLLFQNENAEDLANKIKSLAQSSDLARQMGERTGSLARRAFNQEKHYEEILKIYRSLKK